MLSDLGDCDIVPILVGPNVQFGAKIIQKFLPCVIIPVIVRSFGCKKSFRPLKSANCEYKIIPYSG